MAKSFDAVFHPERYSPMPKVRDSSDFERKWAINRPAVLANMAHAAYLDSNKLTELIERLGASKPLIYDHKGAQAFLAVWSDKAILAFRGSQLKERETPASTSARGRTVANFFLSLFSKGLRELLANKRLWELLVNDVLADLSFKKRPTDEDPNVAIHSGFLGEVDKLWKEKILPDLREIPVDVKVWATGHSLGAAMATIAGLRYPFEEVVTFGEPRVGSGIERAFQAERHVRYVNGDDPVTKVPPKLVFGYEDHGEVVRIKDPDGSTDARYDHSIVYYAQNLWRERANEN